MRAKSSQGITTNATLTAVAALGLASGVPYLLVNDAISAWLADIKIDIKTIGLFSLITLPYGMKFLWAPLLDALRSPFASALGRRRGWLVFLLLSCGLCALTLSAALPATSMAVETLSNNGTLQSTLLWASIVALLLAVASATLDIVVDAFRADSVDEKSLGRGASLYVVGWRGAVVIAGAAVLLLPDRIGWAASYALVAFVLVMPLIATLFASEPMRSATRPPQTIRASVSLPFTNLWERFGWRTIALVIFVLVYRLPDLFPSRMVMPFLMNEVHFTKDEIGLLRQFGGAVVTIIGALMGGALIGRLGVARCLLLFGVLQAASNAGYLWLHSAGHNIEVFIAAVAIENFCNGLVASVFVAYLMSLCDSRVSATQYALFTGLMFGAASLAASPGGFVVESLGWNGFFWVSIAIGLPGILLLPIVAKMGESKSPPRPS